jgi:hypothetical protein
MYNMNQVVTFEQQLSTECANDLAFLKAAYEDCEPRNVRDFHRVSHSVGLTSLAREIVYEGGGSVRQLLVAGTAGPKHDKYQLVDEFKSGLDEPLLEYRRLPQKNDNSELWSAVDSDDSLLQLDADKWFIRSVHEGILSTCYRFMPDGTLIQPNIIGLSTSAQNPGNNLVNFAIAKADILAPLRVGKQAAFNIAMRFFVEQYPDLSAYLHQSDHLLPSATYQLLTQDLLPKFADFERTFMGRQYGLMRQEAGSGWLDFNLSRFNTIVSMFDLDSFNQTMDVSEWSWLRSNAATTDALRQAVAF